MVVSFGSSATNQPPEEPPAKTTKHKSKHGSVREFEGGVAACEVLHGKNNGSEDSKSKGGAQGHHTQQGLFMVGAFGHHPKLRQASRISKAWSWNFVVNNPHG